MIHRVSNVIRCVKNNSLLRQTYYDCRDFLYQFRGMPHGLGYVLMFHRIGSPNPLRLPQCEDLKVSIQHLEQMILDAKKKFDIISIEQVPNRLKNKEKRKFLVFTFDDGYKEILTAAHPVFRKHNIPYTVFLTTSFPERTAILWAEILEDLILSHDKLILSNGMCISLSSKEEKVEGFNILSSLIMNIKKDSFRDDFENLFSEYEIDFLSYINKNCLGWDDVKNLLTYPLFTLGSHTLNHFPLNRIDNEESVRDEIESARALIKEKTGYDSKYFAYPYGQAGSREFAISRSLHPDILLSVLASGGPVTTHTNSLEAIPRINCDNNLCIRNLYHFKNVYMGL